MILTGGFTYKQNMLVKIWHFDLPEMFQAHKPNK